MNLFESCTPLIHISKLNKRKPTEIKLGAKSFNIIKINHQYFAFPKRCPHRGTNLKYSALDGEGIVCPYHGWKISKDGSIIQNNGDKRKCKVEVIPLSQHYDLLWLNKNQLKIPISAPEKLKFCGSLSFDLSAPFHVVLDNFNEGSHTPFVHRLLGCKKTELQKIKFNWSKHQNHVLIQYFGPQKPNFFFNGPFWKTFTNWDIKWITSFSPVRMEYYSKWRSIKSDKVIFPENYNCYLITPNGPDRTWLYAIVFTEINAKLKFLSPFLKKISLEFTKNQIMEDEVFYQKIADIPKSFKNMNLDEFDHPLVEIRKRVDTSYMEIPREHI
jgi:phenylpropionate dioxygenase-like ring-hydroxylating dioxygenase large terminal subunit